MLGKRITIPVLVVSLLFAGLLSARADDNNATDLSQGSRKAGVVQSPESSDAKKVSSKAAHGSSDSQTNAAGLPTSNLPLDNAAIKPEIAQAGALTSGTASRKTAATLDSAVSRGGSREIRVLTMVATGYDGCYECNKPYYGQPSYIGLPLRRGIVAVDPQVIRMGTRLYVEGYGEAIAADQGNAIKGNRIDLFFDSHQEALNFGKKTVKVTIL